jgi:hypothetical protein
MILLALTVVPASTHTARAAPAPKDAAAFAALPAPGKLIEAVREGLSLPHLSVGKKPTSTGPSRSSSARIHMRVQDIATPRARDAQMELRGALLG